MKALRVTIVSLLIITTMLTATSCNIFHNHTWTAHLIKTPTCTEVGILKNLCTECGEATYSEISMTAHNYVNGICSQCGTQGAAITSLPTMTLPDNADNDGMWSFEMIYETASSTLFSGTYSDFMNSLSGLSLKNARVDSLSVLRVTALATLNDGTVCELPLILPTETVSPQSPSASVGVILRADIKDGELLLTYTTGTQISAGLLNPKVGTKIIGFGINKDKELIIYHSNGMISFGGRFAS